MGLVPHRQRRTGQPHRVVLLLEDDEQTLATTAAGADLFGPDLATLMDRLSPMVTGLAITAQAGRPRDVPRLRGRRPRDRRRGRAVRPVGHGQDHDGPDPLHRPGLPVRRDRRRRLRPAGRALPEAAVDPRTTPRARSRSRSRRGGSACVRSRRAPYRLRALVQLHREPDHAGEVEVELLSTVDALPELVSQTSYTRQIPRPLHHLADLAHRVGGVRPGDLRRGRAAAARRAGAPGRQAS